MQLKYKRLKIALCLSKCTSSHSATGNKMISGTVQLTAQRVFHPSCECLFAFGSARCVTALWATWKPGTAYGSTNAWCTVRTALMSPEVIGKKNLLQFLIFMKSNEQEFIGIRLLYWLINDENTLNLTYFFPLPHTEKWRRWDFPKPSSEKQAFD